MALSARAAAAKGRSQPPGRAGAGPPTSRCGGDLVLEKLRNVEVNVLSERAEFVEHRQSVERALAGLAQRQRLHDEAEREASQRFDEIEAQVCRASQLARDVYDQQLEQQGGFEVRLEALRQEVEHLAGRLDVACRRLGLHAAEEPSAPAPQPAEAGALAAAALGVSAAAARGPVREVAISMRELQAACSPASTSSPCRTAASGGSSVASVGSPYRCGVCRRPGRSPRTAVGSPGSVRTELQTPQRGRHEVVSLVDEGAAPGGSSAPASPRRPHVSTVAANEAFRSLEGHVRSIFEEQRESMVNDAVQAAREITEELLAAAGSWPSVAPRETSTSVAQVWAEGHEELHGARLEAEEALSATLAASEDSQRQECRACVEELLRCSDTQRQLLLDEAAAAIQDAADRARAQLQAELHSKSEDVLRAMEARQLSFEAFTFSEELDASTRSAGGPSREELQLCTGLWDEASAAVAEARTCVEELRAAGVPCLGVARPALAEAEAQASSELAAAADRARASVLEEARDWAEEAMTEVRAEIQAWHAAFRVETTTEASRIVEEALGVADSRLRALCGPSPDGLASELAAKALAEALPAVEEFAFDSAREALAAREQLVEQEAQEAAAASAAAVAAAEAAATAASAVAAAEAPTRAQRLAGEEALKNAESRVEGLCAAASLELSSQVSGVKLEMERFYERMEEMLEGTEVRRAAMRQQEARRTAEALGAAVEEACEQVEQVSAEAARELRHSARGARGQAHEQALAAEAVVSRVAGALEEAELEVQRRGSEMLERAERRLNSFCDSTYSDFASRAAEMSEMLREESDTAAELSGLAAEVHAQMVEAVRARADEVFAGTEAQQEAFLADARAELFDAVAQARAQAGEEVIEEVLERLGSEARRQEEALQRQGLAELAEAAAEAREKLGAEAREELLEHAGAVFGRVVSPELSATVASARRELEESARRRVEEMLAALCKREKMVCDKSSADVAEMVKEASAKVTAAAVGARALAEEELRAQAEDIVAAAAARQLEAMEAVARSCRQEEQEASARSRDALEGVRAQVEILREEASANRSSELAGFRASLQEEMDVAVRISRVQCQAQVQAAEEAQSRVESLLTAAEARQDRFHSEAASELSAGLRAVRRAAAEEVNESRGSWEAAFLAALSPEVAAAVASTRAELQEALSKAELQHAAGQAAALERVSSIATEVGGSLRAELHAASTDVLDTVTEARAQIRGELKGAKAAVEAAGELRTETQATVASVLDAAVRSQESCKCAEAAAAECRKAAAEAQAQDVDPAEVVATAVAEARKTVARELRTKSADMLQQLESQQSALFDEAREQSHEAVKGPQASRKQAEAIASLQADLRETLHAELREMMRRDVAPAASGGASADERLAAHASELDELRSAVGGTRRRLCETGRSISRLDEQLNLALAQLQRLSQSSPSAGALAIQGAEHATLQSPELLELRTELQERLQEEGAELSRAMRERARADSAALSAVQRSLERVTAEVATAMQRQPRGRPLEQEVASEVWDALRSELRSEVRDSVAEASSAVIEDVQETLRAREGLSASAARRALMGMYPALREEVHQGLVEEAQALSSMLRQQSAWDASELAELQRSLEGLERRAGEAQEGLAGEVAETLRPQLLEQLRSALAGGASSSLAEREEALGKFEEGILLQVSAHEAATAEAVSSATAVAENHREARRELMEVASSLKAVGQEACAAQERLDSELLAETKHRQEASASLETELVAREGRLEGRLEAKMERLGADFVELERRVDCEVRCMWEEAAAGAERAVAGAARSVAERLEEESSCSGHGSAAPSHAGRDLDLASLRQGLRAELRREWQVDLAEALEEALAGARTPPPQTPPRARVQEPVASGPAGGVARPERVVLVPPGSTVRPRSSSQGSQQRRVTFALDATGQCEQLRSACAEVQRGLLELRRGLDEVPVAVAQRVALPAPPQPPQRPQVQSRGCVEGPFAGGIAAHYDGRPWGVAAELAPAVEHSLDEEEGPLCETSGTRTTPPPTLSSIRLRGQVHLRASPRARSPRPALEEEVVLSP